jgi:DNA mismatch endonuclease, patch repair protein
MSCIRSRAPKSASSAVRKVMQANVGRETTSERMLRSLLHNRGLRFRKDVRPVLELRCKADVVFPRAKICVFVDGCFWHGCPQHYRSPKTNSAWWEEKIGDNKRRDTEQSQILEQHGWLVFRIWEHEVRSSVEERTRVANAIEAAYRSRIAQHPAGQDAS